MSESQQTTSSWTAKQVYFMSAVCVVIGLVFGYFLRGSASVAAKSAAPVAITQPAPGPAMPSSMPPAAAMQQGQPMPSLEDMKRMADKQSESLLDQLKKDPKNTQLMIKIATNYKSAHQFPEAATYFGRALELDAKNVALRDEVAAAQYYSNNVDGAISTLEAGLQFAPNDPSTLFNIGIMKYQKKNDAKGAVAAWQRLLKSNPGLPEAKRLQVEKLISQANSGAPPVQD
ncbi:MAG TPA: hypothetical protein VGL89_10635 [Candidatus Koribacter sp.]